MRGCVPSAAVAVCWGDVCFSACWDTPSGCGPGDPPQVWAWRPPQVWAWRPPRPDPPTSPLGVGLKTCKACWDTTCNACSDTTPHLQNSWHMLLKILPCPNKIWRIVYFCLSSVNFKPWTAILLPVTCRKNLFQRESGCF